MIRTIGLARPIIAAMGGVSAIIGVVAWRAFHEGRAIGEQRGAIAMVDAVQQAEWLAEQKDPGEPAPESSGAA